jgi:hypothetical protein
MSLNRGARRKEKKKEGGQMVDTGPLIFPHSLTSLLHNVPSLIRHGWKSYSQSLILSYLVSCSREQKEIRAAG